MVRVVFEPAPAFPGHAHIFSEKYGSRRIANITQSLFGDLWFAMSQPCEFRPPLATSRTQILQAPHVQQAIASLELTGHSNSPTFAHHALVRIIGAVRPVCIRVFGWALSKVFRWIFCGVHVYGMQRLEYVRDQNPGIPLVFVPTHRSHVDYLLLSYALFAYGDMQIPYIAAGDNLNLPLIGTFLNNCGAFYIQRPQSRKARPCSDVCSLLAPSSPSTSTSSSSREGLEMPLGTLCRCAAEQGVYRAVLREYMLSLADEGEWIEFFLEGGRSRDGSVQPPKLGLLSAFVHAVQTGRIPDVLLVPMTFTYERVLEAPSLAAYQLGIPKPKESLFHLISSGLHFLRCPGGLVEASVGAPVSLREFIQHGRRGEEEKECATRLGLAIHRRLVDLVLVSGTALISCTLLQHRYGMSFPPRLPIQTSRTNTILTAPIPTDTLTHEVQELADKLKNRGCPISSSILTDPEGTVARCLSLLEDAGVVTMERIGEDKLVVVNDRPGDSTQLAYYAMPIVQFCEGSVSRL